MMRADLRAVEASEKIAMRVLPPCHEAAVIFRLAPQIENNVIRFA
jgi:hypothetical protein